MRCGRTKVDEHSRDRCVGGRIELVGDPAQEIETLILICPRASRLGYTSERKKLGP